ncbi:MAG: hypothetical protein DWH80_08840 [Planctomycetota bacterium]|nr:MAG: hypothetical protein DWH80_08840 [Planctomycetota bacterium]
MIEVQGVSAGPKKTAAKRLKDLETENSRRTRHVPDDEFFQSATDRMAGPLTRRFPDDPTVTI